MKRIRLDLDDTLNTLSLDLLRFDGLDFPNYEAIGEWTWGYDIVGATAALKGEKKMGIVEYWSRFPQELWSKTRLAPEFNDILDFCDDKVGMENVLVTTSPTKCSKCCAGKYEWIEKYLPKQLHRQWSITPRKEEYGRDPDSVLIDDCAANCAAYKSMGGKAFCCPRPWNDWYGTPVMDSIESQWRILCSMK